MQAVARIITWHIDLHLPHFKDIYLHAAERGVQENRGWFHGDGTFGLSQQFEVPDTSQPVDDVQVNRRPIWPR